MLQHNCLNYYFKFTFDTVKDEILDLGKGAAMLGTAYMEKPVFWQAISQAKIASGNTGKSEATVAH